LANKIISGEVRGKHQFNIMTMQKKKWKNVFIGTNALAIILQ